MFSDHQSPLFWLFAVFFAVLPRPETLLAIQGFGLAAGGVALFRLSRQYFKKDHWAVALLPLLYWSYGPLRNANRFDFHPEVLMLPLFLWGVVWMHGHAWWRRLFGALAFLAATAAKESAGPVLAGVGFAWLIGGFAAVPAHPARRFLQKTGFILIVVGCAAFYFDVKIVPTFFGQGYQYAGLYERFGKDIISVFLSPVLKPDVFWPSIFGVARLKFLFWTLAPLGFIPLLNWRVFVAALPGYLMLFLSETDHRVNITYHYAIEPAVGLFLALPGAVTVLENLTKTRQKWRGWVTIWIVFWALAAFGRSEVFHIRQYQPTAHMKWLRHEFITSIYQNASIAATNALVPHLATRTWIHHLPGIHVKTPLSTSSSSALVDCVITDSALNNWFFDEAGKQDLMRDLTRHGYEEKLSCGTLKLYSVPGRVCLIRTPQCDR